VRLHGQRSSSVSRILFFSLEGIVPFGDALIMRKCYVAGRHQLPCGLDYGRISKIIHPLTVPESVRQRLGENKTRKGR
jgi:hypothetical protein